ncbi:MAG: ATP-binding cassette domain-containing protein [Bdellovibrionales bacterium]|nr:ATP-binding cassette domain-containing protein [Bdellovibrionales bacterium]
MHSTSKSKNESDNKSILEIKNFSISYSVPYYRSNTFRDSFIKAFASPIDFIFKSDDRVLLLDNISLTVNRGDRVGILGNNGSGKTSLCRYISGIHKSESESIKINGVVKGIFDTEVAILPELSGKENLELLTHFFYPELSNAERIRIAADTEAFCDLGKYIDVPFKLYSKGMKARIFLSLVSSQAVDLLILDEVFNGADYFFNEKITERIKNTIYKSGAVLFVSHSNELIEEVCNRVIVFKNKKIVFDGDPKEGVAFYKEHCDQTQIQGG